MANTPPVTAKCANCGDWYPIEIMIDGLCPICSGACQEETSAENQETDANQSTDEEADA